MTEDLRKAAISAIYKSQVGLLNRLVLMALLSSLGCAAFSLSIYKESLTALVFGVIGIIVLFMGAKLHFGLLKFAQSADLPRENSIVTFARTDVNLAKTTGDITSTTEWEKIDYLKDQDGFLILQSGKLPIACLPKRFLTEQQKRFIISKIKMSQ